MACVVGSFPQRTSLDGSPSIENCPPPKSRGAGARHRPAPAAGSSLKQTTRRRPSWGLGAEAHGIPGEEDRLPDVVKPEIELHDPLQPKAHAAVGRHAVPEGVDVRLQWACRHPQLRAPRLQQLRVMASLGATADLLTPKDHVVGVGVLRLVAARHGVEGPHGGGVAVEEEEVRLELLTHQAAQRLLLLGAEVSQGVPVHAGVREHLHRLRPMHDARALLRDQGGLGGVHLADRGEQVGALLFEAAADLHEGLVDHSYHLVVVPTDGHL
mmetsp:Transcript_4286/g.13050  ORF Transcript_4286/g.13050 Transcript_4286/m.13050 type:complete len:269 (-) Transcript_4286:972-1778(-)